jgi:succinate dehydrogenase / fumarate reductase cytochrome b subunit
MARFLRLRGCVLMTRLEKSLEPAPGKPKEDFMADVNRGNRPLSPFMIGPYYRPQITSISSIMVRITGIASYGFAFLVICWLVAAATSEAAFGRVDWLLTSYLGDLLMLLAAWAIWYHVLGRLRHVVWDFGFLLDVETSQKMGWGMFIGATVLALFTVLVV